MENSKDITNIHMSDMETYLNTLPANKRKHLSIIKAINTKQPVMLHISIDPKIKSFVPFLSGRINESALKEDKTIPRISVAPELTSCIKGYADAVHHSTNVKWYKESNKKYKNGYVVYKIPYILACKPNNSILFDASISNEHWLLSYNYETSSYPCQPIGIIFYGDITYKRLDNYGSKAFVQIYIRVDDTEGMQISPTLYFPKGTYLYEGEDPFSISRFNSFSDSDFTKISESDFNKRKEFIAPELAY